MLEVRIRVSSLDKCEGRDGVECHGSFRDSGNVLFLDWNGGILHVKSVIYQALLYSIHVISQQKHF